MSYIVKLADCLAKMLILHAPIKVLYVIYKKGVKIFDREDMIRDMDHMRDVIYWAREKEVNNV